jgi:dUTP pyrophosphatase
MAVRSGEFVSKYLTSIDGDLPKEAIQPAGVDISIHAIYRITGQAVLGDEGQYEKGERVEVIPHTRRAFDQRADGDAVQALRKLKIHPDDPRKFYHLDPDASYIIEYGEKIRIPENHIGRIYPRSRLMRSGGMLYTALWDPGYEGRGEGQLLVKNPSGIVLEQGMRIGQMVLEHTEELETSYDGTHQGENL